MTPTTEQLKDMLAKSDQSQYKVAGDWKLGGYETYYRNRKKLEDMAPTLAAEVVRLRAIIEKVDQYSPVADDTCDEPGITFTEAIMREWPELRPPSP